MATESSFHQSAFRVPQDRDFMLQILEGNLNVPLDTEGLKTFYLYLLKRDHTNQVKSSDREFYNGLRVRYEQRLTEKKIEIPGVFKIDPSISKIAAKAEIIPVAPLPKKDVVPKKEVPVVTKVPAKPIEPPVKYDLHFVEHLSYPDGTEVGAGEKFVKTWKLINPSDEKVPLSSKIRSFGSNNLVCGGSDCFPFPHEINPKEYGVISIAMQAPDAPGTYTDYFQAKTSTGKEFGETFSCRIVVKIKPKTDSRYCSICRSFDCTE